MKFGVKKEIICLIEVALKKHLMHLCRSWIDVKGNVRGKCPGECIGNVRGEISWENIL